MALPTNKIFLRSPYWVDITYYNLAYITLDLYVWTGDLTLDIPSNPSIQLRSTAFDDYAAIDIAEFARDLVEVTFNGTQDSNLGKDPIGSERMKGKMGAEEKPGIPQYKGGSPLTLENLNTKAIFAQTERSLKNFKFNKRKVELFEQSDLLNEDNIREETK